jgi:hypothetical protein
VDCDSNSRFFPVGKWAREAANLTKALFQLGLGWLYNRNQGSNICQPFASLAGSNHLLGSAGEFGLLLAFLHNSPRTRHDPKGDPAFSMDDITAMFEDKRLPDGWETWKKTIWNWLRHTAKLAGRATLELIRRRRLRGVRA